PSLLERIGKRLGHAGRKLGQQARIPLEQRQSESRMTADSFVDGEGQFAATGSPTDDHQVKRLRRLLQLLIERVDFAEQGAERPEHQARFGARRAGGTGGDGTEAERKGIVSKRWPAGKKDLPCPRVDARHGLVDEPDLDSLTEPDEVDGDFVAPILPDQV